MLLGICVFDGEEVPFVSGGGALGVLDGDELLSVADRWTFGVLSLLPLPLIT